MQTRPKVLLLDDGDLTDVLVALGELGENCVRLPWHQYDATRHFPTKLLVLTARYARLPIKPPQSVQVLQPIQIVFMDYYSQNAQQRLLDSGADFLVRRPISAKRLHETLKRALAGHSERRRALRTPMQKEIRVRDGIRYRSALLADLSLTGCQLVTSLPFQEGATLQVQLAAVLPHLKSLCVTGKVVRSYRRSESRFGEITASGIRFEPVGSETQQQLETALMFRAIHAASPA